jgi:hypothetical protein
VKRKGAKAMTTKEQKEQAAINNLREAGAVLEKKEDRYGTTRSGWWIDDVYLGRNARDAWEKVIG